MDHNHKHGGTGLESRARNASLLTAGFMAVEAVGGWLSGSLALLADAAHMLTDAMALGLAWLAFRVGRLAADPKRSYGYRRAEVLAALINGLAVVGLSMWIVWEAVERLGQPRPVLGLPMLAVAVVGLAVNLLVLRSLHAGHAHEHENINLRGASLHVLGDLVGSVAAVLAGLVILATGWTPIDPLLSLAVAGLILFNAWRLVKSATHILLEGTPEGFDEGEVRKALLAALPGLRDIHHVHAWSLTSGQPLVTLHATIGRELEHDDALAVIKRELAERFDMPHSVVQIERENCPDLTERCG